MSLDLNKEVDDIVAPVTEPKRNYQLIGISALATLLFAISFAWFAGFIIFQIPESGTQATDELSKVDKKIKGNKNSLIYHLPQCPNYGDISEKNIVWFKTEEDAKAAGFRMAKNCNF